MGNNYSPFPLRVSEDFIYKIKYIARKNKRSANKELEYMLEKYIEAFEAEHGEIEIPAE